MFFLVTDPTGPAGDSPDPFPASGRAGLHLAPSIAGVSNVKGGFGKSFWPAISSRSAKTLAEKEGQDSNCPNKVSCFQCKPPVHEGFFLKASIHQLAQWVFAMLWARAWASLV